MVQRRCQPMWALAGLAIVELAVLLDCAALVVDIMAGRRIVGGTPVPEIGLEFRSDLSQAANLAIPAAVLVGGSLFVLWFYCAYRQRAESGVEGGGAPSTRFDPIWSLIGWIVPGLNLVRPPQIMDELTGRRSLVGAWWGLWFVGGLIQVGMRFISPETQQGWVRWHSTLLAANVLLLASLAIAVVLVIRAGSVTMLPPRRLEAPARL